MMNSKKSRLHQKLGRTQIKLPNSVMAYNEKAKSLRQCEAIKPNGERCRNYSRLDSNVCVIHLYPKRKRVVIGRHEPILHFLKRKGKAHHVRQRHNVCRCRAYNWPHRAGGGLCRWPDEPLKRLSTQQGTRSGRGEIKDIARAAGAKMRGVTDSINYERQGDVKDIKERCGLEDLLRKVKGGGYTPDW
jgi:hypothetical protein